MRDNELNWVSARTGDILNHIFSESCVGFASMIINRDHKPHTALGVASMSHTALGVASMSYTALGVASMSHTALGEMSRAAARVCYVRVGVGSAVSSRLLLSG